MSEDTGIRSLSDLSELRQTLAARPPKLLRSIVLVVVALLGAGVAWATLTYSDLTVRATGRIRPIDSEGGETKVNALTNGQVVEVHAHIGDTVKEGELLVRIDSQKLDNDLKEQERLISEARIELTKLRTLGELKEAENISAIEKADADIRQEEDRISRELKQQQVELKRARIELQKAKEEELRIRTLVRQEAAPKTDLEKAESAVREAEYRLEKAGLPIGKAYLETLRKARDLLAKKYAVARNETEMRISQKVGQIKSAEKNLKNLELEKSHTEIKAPIDGTITQCGGHKGDIIQRGSTLFVISQQKGMQMEGYVETRDVGLLKTGMRTKIRLEAFDYQKYGTLGGTIAFISPDSKMEQDKVFYIIRIDLDKDEVGLGAQKGKVKLGMLGVAEIVTGKETILSIMFRKFRKKIDIE